MKKTLILVLIGLFLIGLVPTVQAQEDLCFQKGGTWDTETQTCSMLSGLDINITYPLELSDSFFAQQAVDEFIKNQRSIFASAFLEGMEFYSPAPWSLYIDYETYAYNEDIFSYKFNISEYTGGAHPNLYFQTITFDLANQKLVILEELFTDMETAMRIISPYVQADLTAQQADFADAEWIESGSGENPDNYQNFALTETDLLFFFPPYQVAAYAAGPFTVAVPLSELEIVLAEEFLQ